jgi:hypothetical protein
MIVPGQLDNLVSCEQLRHSQPQPNEANTFWISGGIAQCKGEGMWCPVEWVEWDCEGGMAYAHCMTSRWIVSCQEHETPETPETQSADP